MQYSSEQWLSCCLLNGGLFPETLRARLIQKLMLTPLGPLLTALMNERQLSRTMGKVFGPDTQPSADLIHHFRELIGYNNGRRTLSINRTVLAYAMYYLFYNELMIPDETR